MKKLLCLFLSLALVIAMPVSFSPKALEATKEGNWSRIIEKLNNNGDISVNNAYNLVGESQLEVSDPYEPNDTLDNAYPINLGSTYQSYIFSEYDLDCYRYDATTTGNIRINLSNLPKDYDVALFNSNFDYLVSSDNLGTASETINYNITTKGVYYILVVSWFGEFSTTQKYSLSAIRPVSGVKLDKTSTTLNVGATTSLVATVSPADASNKKVTWKSSNTSVATVDAAGKVTAVGPGSATITVTTAEGSKTASCSIKATLATPASVKAVSSSYNSVKTSWAAVTGASGYEVYRATSSTGTYSKVSTTTAISYNNTGLTTNTTYYYKVRAYRTVGTTKVYSSFSSVVNAKPIPATVTNLKAARASSTSIKTTWSKVEGASGYEVYRSTSQTGTYSSVGTTTNLYFTNPKLTTGKTYYYKVRAYRTIGTTKVYSNWSTVVYAKTY